MRRMRLFARRASVSMKRANCSSIALCRAFLSALPTRGASPAVEIAIRTGPAFAIAAMATKP